MKNQALSRAILTLTSLAAAALLAASVWSYGYTQALEQIAARAESDLALASDRLVTELKRYRQSAVLLAEHPDLLAVHRAGETGPIPQTAPNTPNAPRDLLQDLVDKTGALTAFYASRSGRVLVTADAKESYLIHVAYSLDLKKTSYFQRALQGALGVSQGRDKGFDRRVYIYAAPSFGPGGGVRGVLVVVVDANRLEDSWRGSTPAAFFLDDADSVFITNRSELLFWTLGADGMTDPSGNLHPIETERPGSNTVWHQDLSPYVPQTAIFLTRDLPVIGLRAAVLVDAAPARRLAWAQAGLVAVLCLFFGALLVLAWIRRHTLARANAVLEDRVRARTGALETTNAALRREVSERQDAETALKRAQRDLVQAGKLSALGQMSAGISHELNQPLMAIRQFAENGEAFLARGKTDAAVDNLSRISELSARAARIIKNLRAFARNENEPSGKVDLVAVLDAALDLTDARLRNDQITLNWQRPKRPVWVNGGEVRLGQVFVNLINNAADAMAGCPEKHLTITLQSTPRPLVRLQDSGPGIADPDRIFEPFYSTKQVDGDGMGLGLSISYGLVQSFGGNIRGTNAPDGGAVFTVELDPWRGGSPQEGAL